MFKCKAALALAVLGTSLVLAQEEPIPNPPAVGIAVTAAADENGTLQVFQASSLDGATILSTLPMLGIGGGTSDEARWLSHPDVRKELDLLDDQIQKIDALRRKSGEKTRKMFSAIRDVAPDKRAEFMNEMRSVAAKEYKDELKKILLPHQEKRLEEVSLQMAMKSRGSQHLLKEKLAELLGISDEQKEEMAKKQREVAIKMKKEMERLKAEAEEEVLSVLTKKQRQKLKELKGEKFETKQPSLGGLPFLRSSLPQPIQQVTPGTKVRTIQRKR